MLKNAATVIFCIASTAMTLAAEPDGAAAFSTQATLSAQPAGGSAPAGAETASPAGPVRFGSSGSSWWTVGGGVASEFKDGADVNIFWSYNYFVVEAVELDAELGGWYFNQSGDDAMGINPAINFRWHFLNREKWSLFADIGIGVLAATDEVPDGGSSFDFTPRAGMGFTREISENGTRLLAGVRWQHFSNARIFGDDENPGRDEVMLYAGIVFPF